ncbi:MAG: DNA repair protein RecN [Oscillospiraceae bacterium]|nr:DNA repair protein RecN [Oscillospiraceae bacterium]
MLKSLHIENIAVVERADVEFREGLNVLTGETGAGKSIIIDALYAVTGGRTSRELVRTGADKCLASAVFDAAEADAWCEENGVEPEEGTLIIQRSVSADGRGSCRVNGVPVTAAQLRQLGGYLVDIHGQNDGRQLLDESRHIDYLDTFSGAEKELTTYRAAYAAFQENEREIARLSLDDDTRRRLAESLAYRVQELEKASLKAGEEAELESRSALLRNGEKLREATEGAFAALYGDENSAVTLAGQARGYLSRAKGWSQELAAADESLQEAVSLLEDAAELVRDVRDGLDFSPAEFDRVEGRLAELRRLEREFSAVDEAGLIELYQESSQRLAEIEYSDEALEKLYKKRDELKEACIAAAKKLTQARVRAGKELAQRVERELKELSMPSARFETSVEPLSGDPGFGPKGADSVCFRMSANAGEKPGRIAKIASGGELSRIMLALKTVFGENDPVPTAVFDEIDTGVSGVAASRVGEKLARMGRDRQVLCISHLPQIAAMADAQYCIEKREAKGRTYTTVEELDGQGRARELARLIGGDNITDSTLSAAAEQLRAAEKIKETMP